TEHLGQQFVHGSETTILSLDPLTVSTPAPQWSYALSYQPKPEYLSVDGALTSTLRSVVEVSVASGRIGIGWTNPEDTAFIGERSVSRAPGRASSRLLAAPRVGRFMFRNVASGSVASVFSILGVQTEIIASGGRSYPVSLGARSVPNEPPPDAGGTNIVFDTD